MIRIICRPDKISTMFEEKPDRHSNTMHNFRDHSRENEILIGYFFQRLSFFNLVIWLSRKRKWQDKPNMSRKCFPSDVIQYLGCSSVRTAVSSVPQIIQTPVFRHRNDFRHRWLWHDWNFLVTRNRWHARLRENTKKKHIAREYIRTSSNSSRAHSLNILL